MNSYKKNIKNLILFIIAMLLISVTFYAGVIYTTSSKLEKAERIKCLAATENTTNRSNTSNSTNSSSSSSSNTSSNTTQEQESSNANLKMLGIRPTEYDFSGFKSGTTTYKVTVPSDVEEVEVYGTAQDSNAKVSGLGTKKLEEGMNDLSIVVTAEDGTEKIYTIQVTRESIESSNEEATEVPGEGLESLKIGDLELSPAFSINVYEYTAKYIGEGTKVDVEATATNPEYTVEITGNDGLKEGENIITILVTDADGENVATYQVTVNKSLVDEEAIAREQEEARQKEEQRKMIIIGVAVGVVALIIIIALIVRHKRNKAWAEEYTVPFSGLDEDDEFLNDKKYQREQESNEEQEQSDNTVNVDDEEVWTKEKARKQFLDDYDNSNMYHDQERASKRKHKGKRFK